MSKERELIAALFLGLLLFGVWLWFVYIGWPRLVAEHGYTNAVLTMILIVLALGLIYRKGR